MNYLLGTFRHTERRLIALAALVLLPVFFLPVLPIWHMKLWAPQYHEGLHITIYSNTIRGDLQNINTLNHYVGMHAITPDDFRLRADSAGYRAGKDGKDLGADVDLVGPGPAYERWKKTPEYQQWLKDTKQMK